MRNGISLVLIMLALASIVAGFASGQSAAHPPPTVVLKQQREVPTSQPVSREDVSAATDAFSSDDVVVDRPLAHAASWLPERLAIIVGLCGTSVAVEEGFAHTGYPVAFDLDPDGAEAAKVAQVARDAGDPLYVHVAAAPTRAQLDALRARIGQFDGVASHASTEMARALRGTTLAFFDERGDANVALFARAGVRIVQRDVTADDRSSSSYIAYMLGNAAIRSTHAGTIAVLLRPAPASLSALTKFAQSHRVDLVALR